MNASTYRIGVIGLVVTAAAGIGVVAAIAVSSDPPSNPTPVPQPVQGQQAANQASARLSTSAATEPSAPQAPPPVVRRTKADDPTYVPPLPSQTAAP